MLSAFDRFFSWVTKPFTLMPSDAPALRTGEFSALATRNPFSRYLPYRAYRARTREYLNMDNTYGVMWECCPLAFVGNRAQECLTGLLSQEYPEGTTIQFSLFSDDHVEAIFREYLRLKTRNAEVTQESARHYVDHLRAGTRGLTTMDSIPVRNFRLFVAVKSPHPFTDESIKSIEEPLIQASLAPRALEPGALLDFLRRIFNSECPANSTAYDESRYLSNQVILAETDIRREGNIVRVGDGYAACLTPKALTAREYLDSLMINSLIGGYQGPKDDGGQLRQKFLWTTTIFYKTTPADIRRKTSIMTAQRVGGVVAKDISRRVQECSWVLDDLEQGRYVDLMTAMWIFGQTEEELNRGVARARSLWEGQHFVMQRESAIALPLLIAALPFGLYLDGKNVETLERDFVVSPKAAAHLLPVQGDFAGRMNPVLLYVGRKGQLASIDVFDAGANNHNFLVCAGSGAGKSFLMNKLVGDYFGTGALIRLIDIGYSYEKQCMLSKGRYIDVGEESNKLCLNPFSTVVRDDEEADVVTIASVMLAMAFSATQVPTQDTDAEILYALMKDAVRFARLRDGGEYGVNHVEEYLSTYPKLAGDRAFKGAVLPAQRMGFSLYDFTTKGRYGRLVNGKSTFNISSDEFVVLELERIYDNRQLFQVVALQVVNAITQDLYLSDRTRRRFMLFDEAWKYFSATPMIANMIEEGYRRARKYSGAMGVVTQSPLDLAAFGRAGTVIKSNSAFKFFLESTDFAKAVQLGILDYQGLLQDLANSVRNVRPRYSEVLVDTPFGAGVVRLCPDRYTYWANTTTGHEVAKFKLQLAKSSSPAEAIAALVAAERAA